MHHLCPKCHYIGGGTYECEEHGIVIEDGLDDGICKGKTMLVSTIIIIDDWTPTASPPTDDELQEYVSAGAVTFVYEPEPIEYDIPYSFKPPDIRNNYRGHTNIKRQYRTQHRR
jgi:hypothetical protein